MRADEVRNVTKSKASSPVKAKGLWAGRSLFEKGKPSSSVSSSLPRFEQRSQASSVSSSSRRSMGARLVSKASPWPRPATVSSGRSTSGEEKEVEQSSTLWAKPAAAILPPTMAEDDEDVGPRAAKRRAPVLGSDPERARGLAARRDIRTKAFLEKAISIRDALLARKVSLEIDELVIVDGVLQLDRFAKLVVPRWNGTGLRLSLIHI